MASLNRPMPYSHYPSPGSMQHADSKPVTDNGPGSFGPVLVVMAVISFLGVAASVAGRLCGKGSSSSSSRGNNSSEQQSAEADKGFGATKHLEVMRPLPSSRATVHDVDDAFEIRLVPHKPAGSVASGGGTGIRLQALPLPPRQLGPPPQYAAAAAGAAASRAQASANIGAAREAHPLYGSGAASFVPAQQRR